MFVFFSRMGLHHTFRAPGRFDFYPAVSGNPCQLDNPGDLVADTAIQAKPTEGCPVEGYDSCPNIPGLDPIHNYMDYSAYDCVTEFSQGQIGRMYAVWSLFRATTEQCADSYQTIRLELEGFQNWNGLLWELKTTNAEKLIFTTMTMVASIQNILTTCASPQGQIMNLSSLK